MAEPTAAHPFMPTRKPNHDPNVCGFPGCAKVWNSIDHQPSRYLAPYREAVSEAVSRLSEGAGVPPALLHTERASGGPTDGAPATHTGRPAMHSGIPRLHADLTSKLPPGEYEGTPEALRMLTLGKPGRGKTLLDPSQMLAAGLLRKVTEVQDSEVWVVPDEVRAKEAQDALDKLSRLTQPLKRNGVTTEFHKCDATEVHEPHLWQPGAKTEWFTCAGDLLPDEADYCEHPNGFGVNGCPCGAVAPDEDAPRMFRNLDTGEDEYAIRCPATLDHAYDVYPVSQMVRHLGRDHGWSQDKIDDWAESVGVATQSMIPDPLVEDMAARKRLEADVTTFLNPAITVEDLMSLADNSIERLLTEWWLRRAEEEAQSVVPKAIEYGSNSIMQLGRKMAQLQGREVADDEALELGCWANLVQKVERITDSVMRGERCSDDTIYDVGIYIKMIQRIRDSGSWPGV